MNTRELEESVKKLCAKIYEIDDDTSVFWVNTESRDVMLPNDETVRMDGMVGDYTGKYSVGYHKDSNTLAIHRKKTGKWERSKESGYQKAV